jgi:hypothetical protein
LSRLFPETEVIRTSSPVSNEVQMMRSKGLLQGETAGDPRSPAEARIEPLNSLGLLDNPKTLCEPNREEVH